MLSSTHRVIFGGALLIASAAAQAQGAVIPPIGGGMRLINAQPIGEFKNYVSSGWGFGGDFRWFPGGQQVLSLRSDAAL